MASATGLAKCEGMLEGEPIIKGTRTPARAVVEKWQFGLSPQKNIIHLLHLALALIFEVLSNRKAKINTYDEVSPDIPLIVAVEDKQVRAPPIFNAENTGLQFNQMLLAKNLL